MNKPIKFNNRITVKCGDKISSAHNNLIQLKNLLEVDGGYAQYIVIGSGEGDSDSTLISPVASVKTELIEYNFDADNGTMFATYEGKFGDEIASGTIICEVGLSPESSGVTLVNRATFLGVEKIEKQELTVRVELCLDVESELIKFVSGENLLAKSLLGITALDRTAFTISSGQNYLDENVIMPRSNEKIAETMPAEVSVNDGEITISATFFVAPYELIVSYSGQPVFRGIFVSDVDVTSNVATLRKNASFEISDEHVFYVNNLSASGENINGYDVYPLANGVTCDCPQLIKHTLKKDAKFLSEPSGAFIGTVTEREICVYKVEYNRLAYLYKIKADGNCVTLLSDGSTYDWTSGLTLNYFNGTKVVKSTLPSEKITNFTATVEDGLHHIAQVDTNGFKRYTYSPIADEITEIESMTDLPSDFLINRRDVRFIDYWSVKNTLYKSVSISGYSENNQSTLKTYSASAATFSYTVHGRWLKRRLISGTTRIEFMEGSSNYSLKTGDVVLFCDRYMLLKRKDVLSLLTPKGSSFTITTYNFDKTFGTPVDVVKAGKYILILFDDGQVVTAYPIKYGVTVYCYGYPTNTTVSCQKIIPLDVKGEWPKSKVTLNLTVGGQSEI